MPHRLKITPGCIVRLRSGGPLMTVSRADVPPPSSMLGKRHTSAVYHPGGWWCRWMTEDVSHTELFEGAVLEIVNPTPEGARGIPAETQQA